MAIRQPIISILGHVDHGKCIAPGTRVPLVDGRIMTAEELFRLCATESEEKTSVKDGVVCKVKNSLEVFTFNGQKLVNKTITHAWRLKSPRKLVSVSFKSGDVLLTTPEHPFLTFKSELAFKKSAELKAGDFVVMARRTDVKQSSIADCKRLILERLAHADFVIRVHKDSPIVSKLGASNLQELARRGLFSTHPHTCMKHLRFRSADYLKLCRWFGVPTEAAYDAIVAIKSASRQWRAGHTSPYMRLPTDEVAFAKLGYISGCLAGDGYVLAGKLCNNNLAVQNEYMAAITHVFGLSAKVKKGHTRVDKLVYAFPCHFYPWLV